MADDYKTLAERWEEDPWVVEDLTPEENAALDRYDAAKAAGDDAVASAALKEYRDLASGMSPAKQAAWDRFGELVNAEPQDKAAIEAARAVFNNTP